MCRKIPKTFTWIFLILYLQVKLGESCNFPDNLDGTFESTKDGTLVFNRTTYGTFTIQTQSQTFSDLVFTCHIQSGTKHVSKSQKFTIFSGDFYAYMCLDIKPELSPGLFYYYYGAQPLPQAYNARLKIFPETEVIGSVDRICDEPEPYQHAYSILYKNGTDIADAMTPCPADFQGYFSYDFDDGTNTFCENQTTSLDTCTNTSTVTLGYNTCNDTVLYSASGELYCLFYNEPTSGVYNIMLYNNDAEVDNINTFRFTCVVFERGINVSTVIQHPLECVNSTVQNSTSQNSTALPSPAGLITLTHNGSCPVPSTSTSIPVTTTQAIATTAAQQDTGTASLTGALIGAAVFVAVLILLIIFLFKYQKKKGADVQDGVTTEKKSTKKSSKVQPQPIKKRIDRNARPLFTPAPPRTAPIDEPKKHPSSSIFDMESELEVPPSLDKEYTLPIYSDYGDCSDLEDELKATTEPQFIEKNLKFQQRLRDSGIVMTPAPDSTTPPDSIQRAQSVAGNFNKGTSTPVYGPNYNPVKDTPV